MMALYRNRLEKRMHTAEAVRQASLAVLQQQRRERRSTHPLYWAPFVAAGDWR
jgi:CHAT domain-containing protein